MNFDVKIRIWGISRSLISNLMASNWDSKEIRENDFWILKIKFPAQKFKIEFQILRCRFLNFGGRFAIFHPQNWKSKLNFRFWGPDLSFFQNPIFQKSKFQILAQSIFVLIFIQFWCIFFIYGGLYTKIFPRAPRIPEIFVRQIFLQHFVKTHFTHEHAERRIYTFAKCAPFFKFMSQHDISTKRKVQKDDSKDNLI